MEMTVFAPANLKLRIWSVDGAVKIKAWNAPVEIRTSGGKIQIEDVKSETVSLLCPNCEIIAKRVRSSLRCMGGAGRVELDDVAGTHVYVESSSGDQLADRVVADQLYVSKSGSISGKSLSGRIEFHSQQGAVELNDGNGFVSGSTDSGNVLVKMSTWKFLDKALIESIKGQINLTLPSGFSGEVDVWSLFGKTYLGFPINTALDSPYFGPEPANRLQGRVGSGGEQLKVSSRYGDVRVMKGI